MDIFTIRRENLLNLLKRWEEEEGRQLSEFAIAADLNRSHLSQMKSGKRMGESIARKIEERLGLSEGWMDRIHSAVGESSATYSSVRRIPVIDFVRAGEWTETADPYPRGEGMDMLAIEPELATVLSPVAFALEIEGDSMFNPKEESFAPGDRVIIDPRVHPRPGDFVVAKRDRDQTATFKRYRERGFAADGSPIIDLVPLNPNHATLTISAESPGRIIGVMMQARKFRRVV